MISNADHLADALDELIAKKRAIRQAAIHNLLTGKVRLPGFDGPWQSAFVRDVTVSHFSGPSPTCEERNIANEREWGVLKTTAVTVEHGWNWKAHKVLPKIYWNKAHIEIRRGDVVVTKAGPRHRVGIAAWVDYVPPRIVVSGKMIVLRPDTERISPLMLASAIAAPDAQLFLDQRTTGMAESQVNFENQSLLDTPIRFPHVCEQTAIAAVLSNMDAEVDAIRLRRDKIRAVKQGMLQQLLTGRVRLRKEKSTGLLV